MLQGEAAAEEMAYMLAGRARGLPSHGELWSKIEERTAAKTAAANRKRDKKKSNRLQSSGIEPKLNRTVVKFVYIIVFSRAL